MRPQRNSLSYRPSLCPQRPPGRFFVIGERLSPFHSLRHGPTTVRLDTQCAKFVSRTDPDERCGCRPRIGLIPLEMRRSIAMVRALRTSQRGIPERAIKMFLDSWCHVVEYKLITEID